MRDWTKVKDERCTCGHLKSEHSGRRHAVGKGAVSVVGHGQCRATDECACSQFTWASFVMKDDDKP